MKKLENVTKLNSLEESSAGRQQKQKTRGEPQDVAKERDTRMHDYMYM